MAKNFFRLLRQHEVSDGFLLLKKLTSSKDGRILHSVENFKMLKIKKTTLSDLCAFNTARYSVLLFKF